MKFVCTLFVLLSCALNAAALAKPPGYVTLAWNASTSANVTNYYVYYGTKSAAYTARVAAGTKLTIRISGLIVGRTYYFAATAVNDGGLESEFSNEVKYTVPGSTPLLSPKAQAAKPAQEVQRD